MNISSSNSSKKILISQDIEVFEDVVVENGATLHFCGGRLVNKSTTGQTFYIQGDDVTIIAGPEQIFEGSFDFRRAGKWVNNPDYQPDRPEPEQIWQISDKPAAWTMERAYPQWFGAADCTKEVDEAWDLITGGNIAGGKTKLDTITDASTAINAAIKLKHRGEVLIPRGYYRLAHSVNVLPGIVLRGEGCVDQRDKVSGTILFPWASEQLNYKSLIKNEDTSQQSRVVNLSEFDFPLPPNDVKWFGNGYSPTTRIGFMLTACIGNSCSLIYSKVGEDSEHNPIYSDYPESITYSLATGNRTVGTEISRLSLIDLMSSGHGISGQLDHATLRGILIAGGVRISDVKVYGLSQFVSATGTEYEDLHFIEHCTFRGPVMLKEADEQTLAEIYPKKIYAYELRGYGDGLIFHGNHKSQYSSQIGALYLKLCNGGIVAGNILNSDSLIEMCRGITFESNHVEYGAKLTIASAAVGIRDNFFWRGSHPSIIIRQTDSDLYYYFHSVVDMADNIFFLAAVADQLVTAAESLSPYDVAIDRYACIEMRNCFRSPNRHRNGESSNVGINMAKFWLSLDHDQPTEQVVEDSDSYEPFEEFNEISHIASCGCSINDFNVTPKPITLKKMQQYTLTMRLNKHDCRTNREKDLEKDNQNLPEGATPALIPYVNGWKDNRAFEPSYQYKAWLYLDFRRKILMHGPINMPDTYLPNHSNAAKAAPLIYENIRLVIGNSTDYSNMHLPMGQMWLYMERIATITLHGAPLPNGAQLTTYQYQRKSLALPVCASTQYWDNGENLSGYEWDAGTTPSETSPGFTTPEVNGNVERVQYLGENVECLLSMAPGFADGQPQLEGEWLDGDVIEWPDGQGSIARYRLLNDSWLRY